MTPALTAIVSGATNIKGVAARLPSTLRSEGSDGGPGLEAGARSGSLMVAEARSASGELMLGMRGPNGYGLTARILAWASVEAARGAIAQVGALGPVAAAGPHALGAAAQDVDLRQVDGGSPS